MSNLGEDKWSLSLLLGLPGTGKSTLLNTISGKCSEKMYVLRCSVYGITASIIKGCTVSHLIGNNDDKVDAPIRILDYDGLNKFSQKINKRKIGLIIIDEVSTMTTRQFHIMDLRFRQVMENDEVPFGGIKVILCGDFMQNEAIGGDSLHVNSLLVARYNTNLSVPNERTRGLSAYLPEGVMQRTAEVFNQAHLYFLKEQLRCNKIDEEHLGLVRRLHKGKGVTNEEIQNFDTMNSKTAQDPQWRYAPILVTSNFERSAINFQKAIIFAKDKKEHVFRWKLDGKVVRGKGSMDDILDIEDCPGLWGYFVKGAPVIITQNVNPNKNIANGTDGFYHSMIFEDESYSKYVADLELLTPLGKIITLDKPPDHVVVRLERPNEIDSKLQLDDEMFLIPISRNKNYPDSYRIWLKQKGPFNDPMQVQVTDQQGVQLAFSYTFHKAVGQTIPKLILCLSKRPQYLAQLTYRLLLVALTRVENKKNIKILSSAKEYLSYLCSLKSPEDYFIWIKGFENSADRRWNAEESLK